MGAGARLPMDEMDVLFRREKRAPGGVAMGARERLPRWVGEEWWAGDEEAE